MMGVYTQSCDDCAVFW